jgi:hypothetical protein
VLINVVLENQEEVIVMVLQLIDIVNDITDEKQDLVQNLLHQQFVIPIVTVAKVKYII